MRIRVVISLCGWMFVALTVAGCRAESPTPTETPIHTETPAPENLDSMRLPEGCPPQCSELSGNGIDLSHRDLSGADFTGAFLGEANLSGANLSGANLERAYLIGADLTDADLSNANLTDANLLEANLANADFENSKMVGANLSGTILKGANLNYADLTVASLGNADLQNATLRGALLYTDLREADLRGADLSGADLSGAYLVSAIYDEKTSWPDDFNPEENGAIFVGDALSMTPLVSAATSVPLSSTLSPIPNSYSPGAIGDYVITEITINEPNRFISFSIRYTLVEVEDNRYRITGEIVDGIPPENFSIIPDEWTNLSDLPAGYDRRSIGETWTESKIAGIEQEVSVHRLENETVEVGESSFEAIVLEITPIDQSMRWKLIQYLSYEVPITPIIRTDQIIWEIGPRGGPIYSNYTSSIIEIGRASK